MRGKVKVRALALSAAALFAVASARASTVSGNCTFDLEQHYVWECDGSASRGNSTGLSDPSGTSHPYCSTGSAVWKLQPMVTSLECDKPANFADYVVDEQSVAGLFSAIVALLALAATIRMIRDAIRGRR